MEFTENPIDSPIYKNLPATPKSSIFDLQNQPESGYCDGGGNHQSDTDCEVTEEKTFVLAPTPAQLGKAPLQRRQNMSKHFTFIYTHENFDQI